MRQPLNWILTGGTTKQASSRTLRNRLAATTILAVAPFLGYGRQAYADCVPAAPPLTHLCSGTSAGEFIFQSNANVATAGAPPFVVTSDGVGISGLGNQRFTDNNASTSITNTHGTGLSVISLGADGAGTDGAVTITTEGTISGTSHGIAAYNFHSGGAGDITITVNGTVTGVDVDEPPIPIGYGQYIYPDDYIPNDGIHAENYGRNLTITTGAGSTVTGEHNGIDGRNYGTGNLTITTNGEVTGNEYDAIYARNFGNDLSVTVNAQSVVTGAANGIGAYNYGNGVLDIDVEGQVIGRQYNEESEDYEGGDGIRAYTSGNGLDITTGAESIVYGDDNGIDARNFGEGAVEITAGGYVTGFDNDGIYAVNHGTDLTITTEDQSVVRGGGHGIGAHNFGSGNLTIEANGWVAGYSEDGDGIHAINVSSDVYQNDYPEPSFLLSGNAVNMTIATGANSNVFGDKDGIDARNFGSGFLTINAEGQVTGFEGDGIRAVNAAGEYNYWNPDLGIDNIYFGSATDLKITTGPGSVVTGANDGIDAFHSGTGVFEITVNGTVTGEGEYQYNDFAGSGIDTFNAGATTTVIRVGSTGVVEGGYSGINAQSSDDQLITITNDGTVRNLSGESNDRAIFTYNSVVNIDNNANLIGTISLFSFDPSNDRLDNDGFWNPAGGNSYFGGGSEDTVNNTGILVAADDSAGPPEETSIRQLEFFNNNGGLISLIDGQAGDQLLLTDQAVDNAATGALAYTATDGRLAVDAALGAGADGFSDELIIAGTTAGATTVHVNVVSVNGVNTEGIPVVRILSDQVDPSAEDHFNLDGPVSAGFFTWDLRYDATAQWHELYTVTTDPNDPNSDPVLGAGSLEFPQGFAASQDIWLLTIGTALHRQADLRSLLQGLGVTPVADYGEPVEPTPVAGANMAPGFWYKGFGAYIDRDDEENGLDLDRKQTIYGGMAGFDFGTEEAIGDALLFGVFGGYIVSDLDFKATNTEWSYEGPTVGAYITYLDQAFYADLTVKADFLDIEIDPEDLGGDDADTDALNIGGRIDTGYKFGHTVFIEPQASLAVVHTEIDDVDIFGGTVEFEDETSVRGRLGLRLGAEHANSDSTVLSADVTASVWENFSGDTEVTIVDSGVPDFGVSDDAETTYGDLSLGLSAANPDGWSAFVRGNYLFAEGYEAYTGNAGIRFVW